MQPWYRRLLGIKSQPRNSKDSGIGGVLSFYAQGGPVWTPRDYQRLAQEGYERNPVVYRCVRAVAEAAASVPWLLYEEERVLSRHPLLDLLHRPNPVQGGVELMENFYGFLAVAGNAYLEATLAGTQVRELHVLRPDRMKVIAGGSGWPEAYEYSVNGRSVRFRREDGDRIAHLRHFKPTDDYYGMSPLEAAACAVDIHNAASGWNKALFDNAARPSGALIYKGPEGHGSLSEEQFQRLKSELEQNYQGHSNAGRPLLLEGGLDWKQISLGPRDMDFVEAKNAAAREIALAFGVPPMLLGIPGDNTYANFREANTAFWRQSIIPLVRKTLQILNVWLLPKFSPALKLGVDLDHVPALSSERDALWTRMSQASFISDEEKREAVGYGYTKRTET